MKSILTCILAGLFAVSLMSFTSDPDDPIQICPGCAARTAALVPTGSNCTYLTVRNIKVNGVCGCVLGDCIPARHCLALRWMTITEPNGTAVTIKAGANECGTTDTDSGGAGACPHGIVVAACDPCSEGC